VEVDADSELSAASKASFLDKVRQSNQACQSGDFETAVGLYGEAIALDPCNHILFSNRSAALVKLGHFARALQDASRAVELNAKWPKVSPVQSSFDPSLSITYGRGAQQRTSLVLVCLFPKLISCA
jgi:tetratricopeptide (TPR) repeat protein